MKISIVIPTRRRDETLARCLEALRPQLVSGQDEVIVSDDGVAESTRQMIETRFPFARWVAGPQRGPAANRNHGASLAGGDFILFLDDDVEPGGELLASYRAAVRPDVDVYEGRTTCRAGLKSPLQDSPTNETGGFLWSCNLMMRATFWRSFGGFDELFPYPHLEDVAYHHRITKAGVKTLFVSGATVDHPPRPVPPAEVIAKHQESYFVYCYKYLHQTPSRRTLMSLLVRHRLGAIRQYPASRDSVTALRSLCVEAVLILKNWSAWDKKWRGLLNQPAS